MIIAVILWWVFFALFVFGAFEGEPPRISPRNRTILLAILLGILAVVTFGNPFAGLGEHSARHSN